MPPWAVGASERRVDGDRVTELVKAKDWLANHNTRGPSVNPLVPSEQKDSMPPALPMYLSRDHMHDRNRENSLYDPAQPGLETYVRVTRRRAPPETEAFLAKECEARMQRWQREEAQKTSEAFELLELRSMGVRTALEANKKANQQVAAGEWKKGQAAAPPSANEIRAQELHSKLGIDKVVLVTSPLHIDDTPPCHSSWASDGFDPKSALPVSPSDATKMQMRGGTWPVDSAYFEAPSAPPAKTDAELLHTKGKYAPSSTRAATRASA